MPQFFHRNTNVLTLLTSVRVPLSQAAVSMNQVITAIASGMELSATWLADLREHWSFADLSLYPFPVEPEECPRPPRTFRPLPHPCPPYVQSIISEIHLQNLDN